MRRHRAELEAAPFDGCVFHAVAQAASGKSESFTWLGWGHRAFTRDELKSASGDLASINWSRPRHDFLRFNVTPADLDWFDDHAAALGNARLAAELARAGRCQGILLDTEAYQAKLFDFSTRRDSRSRGWSDYASMARRRGRELMAAFQEGFPGLTVLWTFGPSLVWRQSDGGKKPLEQCRDGLLAPFLDGMIEGAREPSKLVDGHEMSYGYQVQSRSCVPGRQSQSTRRAFLSTDPDTVSSSRPRSESGSTLTGKRKAGTPPTSSETTSRPTAWNRACAAIEQSDEYVWIYTEKPRWWSEKGSVDLPKPYVDKIRQVRRALSLAAD